MGGYFIADADESAIRKEKDKGRELRRSRWWKNRLAAGKCHYCEGSFPSEELTMDHILPLSRGGTSSRGNVVPACKECNNQKKYLLPIEWENYMARKRSDV